MSILDNDHSNYLTLTEAAQRLPGKPHRSSIWRWARRGIQTRRGRIRLRVLKLGRKVLVEPAALDTFAKELADADATEFGTPARQKPRKGQKSSRAECAEHEADRLGI